MQVLVLLQTPIQNRSKFTGLLIDTCSIAVKLEKTSKQKTTSSRKTKKKNHLIFTLNVLLNEIAYKKQWKITSVKKTKQQNFELKQVCFFHRKMFFSLFQSVNFSNKRT